MFQLCLLLMWRVHLSPVSGLASLLLLPSWADIHLNWDELGLLESLFSCLHKGIRCPLRHTGIFKVSAWTGRDDTESVGTSSSSGEAAKIQVRYPKAPQKALNTSSWLSRWSAKLQGLAQTLNMGISSGLTDWNVVFYRLLSTCVLNI